MKQIYVCQYTGKQFHNPLDCQEHEYIHGGKQKAFFDLCDKFILKIEDKFGVKVNRNTVNKYDKLENYINDRMVHWRHLYFDFTLNGRVIKYEKNSDTVGDGRWEWDCDDTVNDLVRDFEKRYILKLRKFFVGNLTEKYSDYRGNTYYLGQHKIEDILNTILSNRKYKNKKIKIEIID